MTRRTVPTSCFPNLFIAPLTWFLCDSEPCIRSLQSILGGQWGCFFLQPGFSFFSSYPTQTVGATESVCVTHIAGRGDRPGLLSLPLLFPWSIAPFISSWMALARQLRVGLPMEAVVYRGMLFSATEA